MLTHRLLKILNLSIAVLLVVFVLAAWWFAWRALPKTSGTIRAPIAAQGNIARDRFGVPHIFAGSWQDAVFLQGYATAQDRMWQMDVLRRLAAGEVSEVVGKAALENDQEARRLRLRRIAEAAAARLSPQDYAVLAAYARGINYYLETNQGKYGLEFAILRYDPRPWSPVDSILVGLQMYRTLTTSWKEEVQKSHLLSAPGADRAKVDALFPPRSGAEVQPGSNAWAVSGAWTSSGKPLLANDPHLEFSIPSIWYQVHLHAPGLNVIGVALPGVPCVIIGHNERIAWGVTNLQFDVQDLYREQLDPRTGQYAFRGTVERARLEPEVIAIKGEKPVSMPVWVTRHGPVVANEGNNYYALRWAAAEPDYQFPFLDLNRASNWQEFTAALARYPGPGQNFVYADIDGNIGYHATGRLPVRKAHTGDVPVDGSTGEFEWEGYIPFDQLPTAFNPASGLIVTANQNPFPPGYSFPVNGDFAAPYRSNQIRAMLQARKGWKPAEMITVQKDVYSGLLHFLARQIVSAYDRGKGIHPEWKDAVDLLRGWNGQMDKELAAPMLTATTYAQLKSMVAERAAPRRGAEYTYPMVRRLSSNCCASAEILVRRLGQGPAGRVRKGHR